MNSLQKFRIITTLIFSGTAIGVYFLLPESIRLISLGFSVPIIIQIIKLIKNKVNKK